jgi:hypothetical protein
MKFNFRKISAIAASALMAGMTMGIAAAANYPAPFVSGGVANAAIVYGTGTGVSQLDLVQAGNIQDSLGTFVKGGSVTVNGGEAFKLEKASNKFDYNNNLNSVYATLGSNNLVNFLADGTYKSGDVDQDYTQKITLSNKALSLFADTNYNDKVPTLGFMWTNGQNILDYDLKFSTAIPFNDLNDTEMPLLGGKYYVLSSTADKIVLLDSSNKVVVTEGATGVTVGDKTVTLEYIADGKVKFNVDGEITDTLSQDQSYELNDGSYIVATDIMYNSKDSGVSSVEFAIGQGKISLSNGDTVEVNDKAVDGLVSTLTNDGGLTNINLAWNSDSKTYLTATDAITMPVFPTIKLVFGGMTFPDSSEAVSLDNGGTMTLTMGNYELPIFYSAGTNGDKSTLGDSDYPLVTATTSITNKWGYSNTSATGANSNSANTSALTGGLDLKENDRFIVTNLDKDLSDIDTAYYEVDKIHWDGTDVSVQLKDLIGTNDLTFDSTSDTPSVGNIDMSLVQVNSTHVYLAFSGSGTVSYNTAVSKTGLEVTLPAKNDIQTLDLSSGGAGQALTFTEANKDGDLGAGMKFTATVAATSASNDDLEVTDTNVTTLEDSRSSKVYMGYVPSDLASKVTFDKSGDENTFDIAYYGTEATADVQVIGGVSTTSSGSNVLGNILVKDSEVSSVATKNLIVVGGSCINSAAAALVGGAKCGAAWTTATGIGTGQFLIKGYATSTLTSGVALLVAGYDAEDTVKATTYLTNKVVDTSKTYQGTTTTETAVVID